MFVNRDWFFLNRTLPIARIRCIPNYEQEPYYVLKKGKDTPLYDERFVNYGYNKMQHMRHLTYVGYSFSILTNAFTIDIPHPKSQLKENYLRSQDAMKSLYLAFLYNPIWETHIRQTTTYCRGQEDGSRLYNQSISG